MLSVNVLCMHLLMFVCLFQKYLFLTWQPTGLNPYTRTLCFLNLKVCTPVQSKVVVWMIANTILMSTQGYISQNWRDMNTFTWVPCYDSKYSILYGFNQSFFFYHDGIYRQPDGAVGVNEIGRLSLQHFFEFGLLRFRDAIPTNKHQMFFFSKILS